jgi:hypothetical protein
MGPPVERECAVEPVGVEIKIPSPLNQIFPYHSKKLLYLYPYTIPEIKNHLNSFL